MGRYYARHQKLPDAVADAIADHYKPLGPNDTCPDAPVSVAVALADKIDTLTGFFAIDEKPTGSKDPFALRRAALGIIRLILENKLRLKLRDVLSFTYNGYYEHYLPTSAPSDSALKIGQFGVPAVSTHPFGPKTQAKQDMVVAELMDFFADRLKVALKEQGVRHDLITAVFGLGDEDDLTRLRERVDALKGFVESAAGKDLLAAYKRANNIVRIEEKKDGAQFKGDVVPQLFSEPEEREFNISLGHVGANVVQRIEAEEFVTAMKYVADMREVVDKFFDKVVVNDANKDVRANRLRLLTKFTATLSKMADFSRIEG
jgi:glycyl-tRNA synthetase beta chain